jgi:hypothetical protein
MLGIFIFQVPLEFFVNLCCPKKWGSTFVMAGPKCNVVFDDGPQRFLRILLSFPPKKQICCKYEGNYARNSP